MNTVLLLLLFWYRS